MSKINEINDYFKVPIFYNKNKILLNKNIISDLELVETVDPSNNSIYKYLFDLNDKVVTSEGCYNNQLSNKLIQQISDYYTTDVDFLKDNQQLLRSFNSNANNNDEFQYTQYAKNYNKIVDIWNEIKNDTGFKERYYFIDWPMWEFLNKSQYFLQFMSIYNMASPVISLLVPIIILIIPFFIIRLKGLQLTMQEYIEILKVVITHHSIGRLFTQFSTVSLQEKIYLIVSAGFYLFSIYQNFLVCIRFHQNMSKIHQYFNEFKIYLDCTINSMNNYYSFSKDLHTHNEFNVILNSNLNTLQELKEKLGRVSDLKYNVRKLYEIGHILKTFYEIYDNQVYNNAIMYSLGFNGYIDTIIGLQENLKERKISFVELIEKSNEKDKENKTNKNIKNVFKNNYYACLKDVKHVKNNIKLNKNLIISGPNASGKTTVIKSVLINIIVSQQFGCGFYDSATLKPYDNIHCYLNIPDTSGRDSLFQAEARRCKEIIDIINKDKHQSHFCAFDELYSGTNPEEATISAVAFMEYIIKNKNVNTILTTHFIKVCKKLKKNKLIENNHMGTIKKDNKLQYLYELRKGISNVKGGINVLYEMNYPSEIIERTIMK
jgi:DNA mismatch repair ATPase MutS